MCGIAGVVFRDAAPAENAVRAMLPAMSRRGPDAEGFFAWPCAGFGHRRLAILDLSPAGSQPMVSDDGQIGLVFNGCVYNFPDLRRELESRGCRFRSQCDTEVLLLGYREWGIDALLSRVRGMFAFAVWDQPNRRLTLARDRLGVKPLAYREFDEGLAFASTPEALRRAGFADKTNPQAVLEFLDLGFVPDDLCIHEGVRKLPAAHVLEWSDGRVAVRRYWDLPGERGSRSYNFEESVKRTEDLLIESVRLRLISDVPLGALLSGGIDSTLVCWALSELKAEVRAFTVGTAGDSFDESAEAAVVAGRLGIEHHVVTLDTDAPLPIEELVEAYSEPFASPSSLGMLRVSRAVKPHATVLLTGDGADDVFLGYPFFFNAWKAQKLAHRLPRFAPAVWDSMRPIVRSISPLRRLSNFADYALGGIGGYGRVRWGIPYFEERGLTGAALAGRKVRYREVPASFHSARQLVEDVFQLQRKMHFGSEFLTKVDGGTMYYSLEARAPFLDQEIWTFASQLSPEVLFHQHRLKSILREIVHRRVGTDVASRRKQGFTIPVEHWLASHWSAHLRDLRHDSLLVAEDWIRPGPLVKAIDDSLSKGYVPQQLWFALVLEHWLRKQKSSAVTPYLSEAVPAGDHV